MVDWKVAHRDLNDVRTLRDFIAAGVDGFVVAVGSEWPAVIALVSSRQHAEGRSTSPIGPRDNKMSDVFLT